MAALPQEREVLQAAPTLGLEVHVLNAGTEREFDSVFAKLNELQVSALMISAGVFFTSHVEQLGTLAARHAIPAIYARRGFATAGGLLDLWIGHYGIIPLGRNLYGASSQG